MIRMADSLIKIEEYAVFTFATTSHALKAEKILKSLQAEFMIMPTLREISSSCGLSVKLKPENMKSYYQKLISNDVPVDGVYQVQNEGRRHLVTPITV